MLLRNCWIYFQCKSGRSTSLLLRLYSFQNISLDIIANHLFYLWCKKFSLYSLRNTLRRYCRKTVDLENNSETFLYIKQLLHLFLEGRQLIHTLHFLSLKHAFDWQPVSVFQVLLICVEIFGQFSPVSFKPCIIALPIGFAQPVWRSGRA